MGKKIKAASKNIPDNENLVSKLSSAAGKLPKKKNGSEPKTYGKSGKIGG
ncbi:hypothetical protein SAMN05421813_1039 [Daejeonella rubra]|uniref:Uncharacterized protein n=1 Tax=Daejeonella rubra TaxID=990371 RepID=A0A1G9NFA8_9SPHI|nr:hypothetical protein [Daejeonella rubra]SDL85074.1 hypothetical protein SAMN05421813_1039 [Daejeonella rubra]